MPAVGLGPEFVCESCHLPIRGRIPGVQRVTITVSYNWDTNNTELVSFTVHDAADCLAPLGDIITEFIQKAAKHKR